MSRCNQHRGYAGTECLLEANHASPHMDSCGYEWPHSDGKLPALTSPPVPQIFLDAAALISGPRRESYGDYASEAQRIAAGWSMITGFTLQTRHVPMMMVWLKLVRESYQPGQDNRTDCAGYLALLDEMLKVKP